MSSLLHDILVQMDASTARSTISPRDVPVPELPQDLHRREKDEKARGKISQERGSGKTKSPRRGRRRARSYRSLHRLCRLGGGGKGEHHEGTKPEEGWLQEETEEDFRQEIFVPCQPRQQLAGREIRVRTEPFNVAKVSDSRSVCHVVRTEPASRIRAATRTEKYQCAFFLAGQFVKPQHSVKNERNKFQQNEIQ